MGERGEATHKEREREKKREIGVGEKKRGRETVVGTEKER